MNCDHEWIANSGRGGEPSFRLNRHMGSQPIMSVACLHCSGRTWLTEAQWMAHLEARAEIEQIGEEVEGRGPETVQTLTEENGQLRARIAELEAKLSAARKELKDEERDCIEALKDRDDWHDRATALAEAVGEFFGVDVGDYSNANCPIEEAHKILNGEYVSPKMRAQVKQAGANTLEGEPHLEPESKDWHAVCDDLDTIRRCSDDAIHRGLCMEDWFLLDDRLDRIFTACGNALRRLRGEGE